MILLKLSITKSCFSSAVLNWWSALLTPKLPVFRLPNDFTSKYFSQTLQSFRATEETIQYTTVFTKSGDFAHKVALFECPIVILLAWVAHEQIQCNEPFLSLDTKSLEDEDESEKAKQRNSLVFIMSTCWSLLLPSSCHQANITSYIITTACTVSFFTTAASSGSSSWDWWQSSSGAGKRETGLLFVYI